MARTIRTLWSFWLQSWPGVRLVPVSEVGVLDGRQVAGGAFDAESEEVAEAADVPARGPDLVEDAVLAQRLGPEPSVLPGEGVSCGDQPGCCASVDEQVRVDAVGPDARSVVEPGREAGPDRCGEGDVAFAEEQALSLIHISEPTRRTPI